MASILVCAVCGMAAVCAVLVCPVRVARPVSCPSQCSTAEYCSSCRALFVAGRVVCGCVSVRGLCVVGYPLCAPPSQWWLVGALWMVGGIAWEGRWCRWFLLLLLLSSPSDISVPLVVCWGAVLKGGVWCVACCPRVWIGATPSCCSRFPVRCGGVLVRMIVSFSFLPPLHLVFSVTVLLVWGGVFVAGLCRCGMAVVVYAGWDGGVCGLRFTLPFLFFLLFFFFFFVLVFGVVRAQLCEHARYPRTPLRFLLFCLVFFAFSFVGMAAG